MSGARISLRSAVSGIRAFGDQNGLHPASYSLLGGVNRLFVASPAREARHA